ncbi:Coiled-coil domain-containing protein 166, partial [Calypte anna]
MAPKSKQTKANPVNAGKNKEAGKTKGGDAAVDLSDMERVAQERKSYLVKEYKTLTEKLNTYRDRVDHFLLENKFLEREAQQNEEENKVYLSYLKKHKQRCQDLLITLNDQNRADLSQAQLQKEEVISQYTQKEQEVRSSLTAVEQRFSQMKKEVEDLQPFKEMSAQQTKKIEELEKELLTTKVQLAEEMRNIKSNFLRATAECQEQFQQKVQTFSQRAKEAAGQALLQY